MSLFIDSGAGLVLSIWFILALVLNTKNIYNCEANNFDVVWCSVAIMNGQMVYVLIAYIVKQLNHVWLTENNRATTTNT